jgi:hypothetical protein
VRRRAAPIQERVLFHNTGPNQLPGLIVMELDDHAAEPDMDRHFERVVVLVNANDTTQTFGNGFINDQVFALHPIQQGSADSVVRGSSYDPASGAFTVPGRTTAVFVTYDEPEDMIADLIDDVDDLIAAGVLNDGQGNALTVKLEQALSQLAAGKRNRRSTP